MKNDVFYLIIAAMFLTAACKEEVRVTGVYIDPTSVTLNVGESLQLTAIVTPDDATEKTVYWDSYSMAVTVDDHGYITGETPVFDADIRVSTKDGHFDAYCSVSVMQQLLPEVVTNAVTHISGITATFGGTVTKTGTPPYTERGVCYSTSPNPTTDNHKMPVAGLGAGSFSVDVTGLHPNTVYYVRAYAIHPEGTAYGAQVSFTTSAATQ